MHNMILADGIAPEGLLILGVCGFLLPAALVVLSEAFVLRRVLGAPRVIRLSLFANLASGLAGVVPLILFETYFNQMVPSDLHLYFPAYFRFSILRYLVYFVLSVVVEFAWGLNSNRRQPHPLPAKKVFLAFLLANMTSYALLAPLFYFINRPTHTIAAFTADAAWAQRPALPLFYIDPISGYLMKTNTAGEFHETVVPEHLTDYQLAPDLQTCVFMDGDQLYYVHPPSATPVRITAHILHGRPNIPIMAQIALSPTGQRVAFIEGTEHGRIQYDLVLFDAPSRKLTDTGNLGNTDYEEAVGLAWTMREDTIVCRLGFDADDQRVTIQKDNTIVLTPLTDPSSIAFCENFSSFAREWGYVHDEQGSITATVMNFITSNAVVVEDSSASGSPAIRLQDSPGIPIFNFHRAFGDMAILPSGRECLIQDDTFSTIYLLDIPRRTVGKVIAGNHFALPIPRYRAERYFTAKSWP